MASLKKLEDRVKTLQRLPENKICFDCNHPGIQTSICMPFGIFICTPCSGLHRQFDGHLVYTISMTTFTEKLVSALEAKGNALNKAHFLARFTDKSIPRDGSNPDSIKRFIKMCFIDKTWVASTSVPRPPASQTSGSSTQTQKPQSKVSNIVSPSKSATSQDSFSDAEFPDFINPSSLEQPRPSQQQHQHRAPSARTSFSQSSQHHTRISTPIQAPAAAPAAPAAQLDLFADFASVSSASTPSVAKSTLGSQSQFNFQSQSAINDNAAATSFAELTFSGAIAPQLVDQRLADPVREQSRHFAAMLIKNPTMTPFDFFTVIMSAAQITAAAMAKKEPMKHTPVKATPISASIPATRNSFTTPVKSSPVPVPSNVFESDFAFNADFDTGFSAMSVSNSSAPAPSHAQPHTHMNTVAERDEWASSKFEPTTRTGINSSSVAASVDDVFNTEDDSNPFSHDDYASTLTKPSGTGLKTTSSARASLTKPSEETEDDIFGDAMLKTQNQPTFQSQTQYGMNVNAPVSNVNLPSSMPPTPSYGNYNPQYAQTQQLMNQQQRQYPQQYPPQQQYPGMGGYTAQGFNQPYYGNQQQYPGQQPPGPQYPQPMYQQNPYPPMQGQMPAGPFQPIASPMQHQGPYGSQPQGFFMPPQQATPGPTPAATPVESQKKAEDDAFGDLLGGW